MKCPALGFQDQAEQSFGGTGDQNDPVAYIGIVENPSLSCQNLRLIPECLIIWMKNACNLKSSERTRFPGEGGEADALLGT